MPATLREIAEDYRLYVVKRTTRARGLQGPHLVVFEPTAIWWQRTPVVVDAFPTHGSAAARIKRIARKIEEIEDTLDWDDDMDERAYGRRVDTVQRFNVELSEKERGTKRK